MTDSISFQASWIASLSFVLLGAFTKLSIFSSFLRSASKAASWYRTCIVSAICFTVCYMLAMFLTIMFTCQPVYKVYDAGVDEGRCLNIMSLNLVAAVWNGVTDFVVLTLAFNLIRWSRLSGLEKSIFVAFEVVGLLYVASPFLFFKALSIADLCRLQEHCYQQRQSPSFVSDL